MSKAWERLPGETDAQWHAFCVYRDLGPGRSREKAWKIYAAERHLKGVLPSRSFSDWMTQNRWVERVSVYDAAEFERIRIENEQKRHAARQVLLDEAANVARSMIVLARGVELPVPKGKRACPPSVARSAQRDVLKFAGIPDVNRIELTGKDGEPVKFTPPDLSALSDDELLEMRRLLAKATREDDGEED